MNGTQPTDTREYTVEEVCDALRELNPTCGDGFVSVPLTENGYLVLHPGSGAGGTFSANHEPIANHTVAVLARANSRFGGRIVRSLRHNAYHLTRSRASGSAREGGIRYRDLADRIEAEERLNS